MAWSPRSAVLSRSHTGLSLEVFSRHLSQDHLVAEAAHVAIYNLSPECQSWSDRSLCLASVLFWNVAPRTQSTH